MVKSAKAGVVWTCRCRAALGGDARLAKASLCCALGLAWAAALATASGAHGRALQTIRPLIDQLRQCVWHIPWLCRGFNVVAASIMSIA